MSHKLYRIIIPVMSGWLIIFLWSIAGVAFYRHWGDVREMIFLLGMSPAFLFPTLWLGYCSYAIWFEESWQPYKPKPERVYTIHSHLTIPLNQPEDR